MNIHFDGDADLFSSMKALFPKVSRLQVKPEFAKHDPIKLQLPPRPVTVQSWISEMQGRP